MVYLNLLETWKICEYTGFHFICAAKQLPAKHVFSHFSITNFISNIQTLN